MTFSGPRPIRVRRALRAAPAALLLAALDVTAWAPSAAAQPAIEDAGAEARRLFEEGVAALGTEDYPTALVAFQRAYELRPRAMLLYNIGMCQRAMFRLRESIDTFHRYLEEAGAGDPADLRRQAETSIPEMESSLATVRLVVTPAGAAIVVDGEAMGTAPLAEPLRLDPGSHLIEAHAAGHLDARDAAMLMAGETIELTLDLIPVATSDTGIDPNGAIDPGGGGDGIVSSWWLWTLVGAVAIGGAVTAGVLLWPDEEDPAAWTVRFP